MRIILLLTLLCVILFTTAHADELPLEDADATRFAANPRQVKNIGDPFVLRAGSSYYTFATGGSVGFNVWQTNDLMKYNWNRALKRVTWASGSYWAPEVYAWNGRYAMLFTCRWKEKESLRIGLAFADAPEGPYEDAVGGPLFDFGYAAIDATLVTDDEGTPYLIYSRDCSENMHNGRHESHLYGVQMTADLLQTVGEPVLLTHPDSAWEYASGDWRWNEGPAVLRRDGKYYLFYSANYYAAAEYQVGVAVADHPLGPYVKQANNPLLRYAQKDGEMLVSGPGHNSFFTVGDEIFTAYHTHTDPHAPSGNRQLCIDRVGFHADGTAYINGPTLAPQLRPLADLGLVNHMKQAVCAERDQLLIDGDTCRNGSAADYVWHGAEADFTWKTPVTADMLLIYPAMDSAISGRVIINDTLEAAYALDGSQQVGQPAVLAFAEMEITSLKVVPDLGNGLGEVLLIGR